ncbi:protein shisa-like-1 [Neopelma chrysocephalum]|uniref:protein shisa-like-1 n=1 Tax=Neopelma chrysocephalum TaxID=114329 RepID=UPI000FCD44D0|nr:protein shisa-like-1 [Neopelma chrysocephalum]
MVAEPGPLGLVSSSSSLRGLGRLCSVASLQGPPCWSWQPVPPAPCGSRSGDSLLALSKPLLPAAVSVQNLHLCEGYVGRDGRSHPGFYCPRLTDPPGHRYCCQPSPHALKSCCSQLALEALTGVNLSSLASPELLRNPLALPFVGLYGLLVLLLMAIDLCHFYWTRRCHLGRLLPCARCPPCRPRGGPPPCAQPSHGAPSLPRPSRGC